MRRWAKQTGQTLVEVLVAIGLSGVLLPALITAVVAARESRAQEPERMQAAALLREADEAVRSVREKGWTNLATNGTYKPAISGSSWSLTSGAETVGNFTRQIVVSDVQRNASGAIVTSGGTVDASTKKVVTTVSWSLPTASSISNESFYQRWQGNAAWAQTTQAQFDTGTKTNVVSTNTAGGEVQLGTIPGTVTWGTPTIAGSYDVASSTTDANDVFVDSTTNRAYIVNGTSLVIINVANPAAPALLGTYNAAAQLNGVYVVGNFAYVASTNNTAELTVVNVTTPATPTLAGSLNLGDTADATSVFVSGSYAYVGKVASGTSGINEFYIIEVTTPTTPTLRGSLNLSTTVNSVYVSGNFAYLATSITSAELTIINVTSKTVPVQAGIYNTTGTAIATDVFAVGTTVYITKANNTSGAEFFIINAAIPAAPTLVGSYEAGAALNGVYVSGTSAFLATAVTNAQFRVLNITTPATPTVTGSFNLTNASNDIVQVGNYAYVASQHDTRELTIMQGTVEVSSFQTSGTFESASFDATVSAAFNYLTFTITEPASTDVSFQIATNNDNATWNYLGPDGTASTFYTAPVAVRLNTTGRYIRYKATLTGPGTSTPILSDSSINYSP